MISILRVLSPRLLSPGDEYQPEAKRARALQPRCENAMQQDHAPHNPLQQYTQQDHAATTQQHKPEPTDLKILQELYIQQQRFGFPPPVPAWHVISYEEPMDESP